MSVISEASRPAKSTPPRRRSQAERRSTTKARLLEAAIECLFEFGYNRTTTSEIARRAGLSRGALVHFQSKTELLVAAVEYLTERHAEDYVREMAQQPDSEKVGASIDLLWDRLKSPSFYAWLELAVAARTDPELLTALRGLSVRLKHLFGQTHQQVFKPLPGWEAEFAQFPIIHLATMQGLVLATFTSGLEEDPAIRETWLRVAKLIIEPRAAAGSHGDGQV